MSTINPLLSNDNWADSLSKINTNIDNLNTDKLEDLSNQTTDNLSEWSTNKYFSGKTQDDLPDWTTYVKTENNFTDTYKSDIDTNNSKVSFPEAPADWNQYARKDANWEQVTIPDTWWHNVQDEWVSLNQRDNLNFVWNAVNVTDDSWNNTTTVTIDVAWEALPDYTITNATTDRELDADNYTLDELADLQSTVINDINSWLVWPTWPQGVKWDDWVWIATWWTAWQVLSKIDWTDYNTEWVDVWWWAVDSVNWETWAVTLTTWDISEDTDKNYMTDAEKTNLSNQSGTNTWDQDLSWLALKSNVLELNNTTAFTPDSDYEPATKKYVDDNAWWVSGWTRIRAKMSSNQDIPNTTYTKIAFDYEYFDTWNEFDTTNYTFTPSENWYYNISSKISFYSADAIISYRFLVDWNEVLNTMEDKNYPNWWNQHATRINDIVYLTAWQVTHFEVYHNYWSDYTVQAWNLSMLSIFKIN